MTSQYTLTQLADLITELCDASQNNQQYRTWDNNRHEVWRTWTTSHPGLLQQLRDRYQPGATTTDEETILTASTFGSRPPIALDALNLHIEIAGDINRWSRQLHHPYQPTIEQRARQLVGARLDNDDLDELHRNATSWVRRARILTGWDSRPFAPRTDCLNADCTSRTGLRLHADTRTGMCVTCGTTWTDTDGGFARLVEHVHANATTKAAS